jgi:hypothetical protein
LSSEVQKPVASFEISNRDPQWEHWLVYLTRIGKPEQVEAAKAAGTMTVYGSKWPKDDSPPPKIRRQTAGNDITARMIGEGAAK